MAFAWLWDGCHYLLVYVNGITLIPVYIPTHLNVEADYLLQGWLVPEWHLLLHRAQAGFKLWGQAELELLASSHTNQYYHYYTLEIHSLWFDWFHQFLDIPGELCISSSFISIPNPVHVSGRTCHRSVHTSKSSCTLLDGDSLASTVLNILEDMPHRFPIIKDVIKNCWVGPVLKGLWSLH